MSHRNLNTSISIPVWQIIATALLLYLLPPPESVEIILLSSLKYKQSVLVVKALLLAIVVLVPFYLHQRAIKPLSKQAKEALLSAIKNSVESKYEIHRSNTLTKELEKAVNKEVTRGFSLPSGSLNGAIIDLYINEFSIFASILENSIKIATTNINTKGLHKYLSLLIIDMLNDFNTRIKTGYKMAAEGYWGGKIGDFDLNKHFANIADNKAQLQIDKILSMNEIGKVKT